MDFILAGNQSAYQIDNYEPGVLHINQQAYQESVLVSATSLSVWRPQSVAEITIADLEALRDLNADVILLGTGMNMAFLAAPLRAFIEKQRLSIEVMSTSAACRTFHVLSSEQRLVYAALLI